MCFFRSLSLSLALALDIITPNAYDSPCGKHIIPKWIWYSVVATDDYVTVAVVVAVAAVVAVIVLLSTQTRFIRVFWMFVNLSLEVSLSFWKPFTLDCRNKHIYSIHQRDICSLSPFRYVWVMSIVGLQASDRAIYMEQLFFYFLFYSWNCSMPLSYHTYHTHTHTSQQDCDRFMQMNRDGSGFPNSHSIDAIQRFLLTRNSYKKNFKWTETEDHCCKCQKYLSVRFVVVDRKRYRWWEIASDRDGENGSVTQWDDSVRVNVSDKNGDVRSDRDKNGKTYT